MDDFPHIVKFVFKGSVPHNWDDTTDASPPSEWCAENVGLLGYQWKRLVTHRMVFYMFKKPDDATIFKLTWSDFT
jgi:hypothetical protein